MREKKCGILDYARRMKKEVVVQKVKIKYLKSRAKEIVEKSLTIAADICVYTNHTHTIEELEFD